jgi:AraC-like DNA-binding protein
MPKAGMNYIQANVSRCVVISAPNPASLHFSTRELSPLQRLPAWYEVFRRSTSRRYCSPIDETCHVEMRIWGSGPDEPSTGSLPNHSSADVRIQRVMITQGVQTHRAPDLLTDGNDDLVLNIQEVGDAGIVQCGREATASAGMSILTSNAEVSTIAFSGPVKFTSIALSRKMMTALAPGAEDAIVRPRLDSTVLPMLMSYLGIVEDQSVVQSAELRRAVAAHVYDLCALAIGASRDAMEIANGRGLRAARLRALKADIARNLTNGPVTAAALARRNAMTPRYVHKLFEGEGVSLSRFVRGLRLARVHRNLINPNYAGHSIGALAFDAGFGDLSTFNHEFRRHYGMTPSALRAAVAKGEL